MHLDESWALTPSVALRPEPFGALAYHFGNRKLIFLKRPELVTVVRGLGAADGSGLQAVEGVTVAALRGGGAERERVEQRRGLAENEGGGRDVLTREGGQVGLLLLVGAPQRDRRGDGGGGEAE